MSMRSWLRDAAMDVRLSIRGFSRERMFTASVLATLALGTPNHVLVRPSRLLIRSSREHWRAMSRAPRDCGRCVGMMSPLTI
jgi:hypothetical protein